MIGIADFSPRLLYSTNRGGVIRVGDKRQCQATACFLQLVIMSCKLNKNAWQKALRATLTIYDFSFEKIRFLLFKSVNI